MSILLMGPRGCGKTTIGRRLAERLGRTFIDLDDITRRSFDEPDVHAIWSEHGEAGWRRAELAALESVLPVARQVVALGGGTPVIDAAREALAEARSGGRAWIVYLRCTAGELRRRLRGSPGDRPSLTGADPVEEVEAILESREPTYLALADLLIEADDMPIDSIVDRIEQAVQARPAH